MLLQNNIKCLRKEYIMKRFKIVYEDSFYTLYVKRVWLQRQMQISSILTLVGLSFSYLPKYWDDVMFFVLTISSISLIWGCFAVVIGELWVRDKTFINEEKLHEYIAELNE
jgi:hypothetical protein